MLNKVAVFLVGFCSLSGMGIGLEFTVKLSSGWNWVEGGDLNKSIAGWQRYYQYRQSPFFSATYKVKEIHGLPEVGGEVVLRLSSRWGVGIQACWQRQQRSGDISSQLAKAETTSLVPSGTKTIQLEETSIKDASFTLEAIPVALTINYLFLRREKFSFEVGVGGGIGWGKLTYGEDYRYFFRYTEEVIAPASSLEYTEAFSSSGEYQEKTGSYGISLFSRLGLCFQISSTLSLIAELFIRSLPFQNWEGESTESFNWQQNWGPGGAYFDRGESKETVSGRLWRVDVRSSETGSSYPRLVFADDKPASSAYASVRPARLNLSGVGLRLGLAFGFGRRT